MEVKDWSKNASKCDWAQRTDRCKSKSGRSEKKANWHPIKLFFQLWNPFNVFQLGFFPFAVSQLIEHFNIIFYVNTVNTFQSRFVSILFFFDSNLTATNRRGVPCWGVPPIQWTHFYKIIHSWFSLWLIDSIDGWLTLLNKRKKNTFVLTDMVNVKAHSHPDLFTHYRN